ncbi:hypothetical protein [Staphylococcus epidermidis]|uniref:hypothetical protein n=1 Tax=Staphylococcus epidermidis TaxID=1282 RepID=UPI0011A1274B|nr:hypothetical protein [Staphylococcus epidermidis]
MNRVGNGVIMIKREGRILSGKGMYVSFSVGILCGISGGGRIKRGENSGDKVSGILIVRI